MSVKNESQMPEPIHHALAALEVLRAENADLAMQLEKALPSYALRQSQRGDVVSVEGLLHAARQGVAKLKGAFTAAQTTPRSLLERYQDITIALPKKRLNCLPLVAAAVEGNILEITRLLDDGTDIHADAITALLNAAYYGQTETVRLLLDRGADVHAENNIALRGAVKNGNIQIIRLLLDRDADIHVNNDEALRVAAEHGHMETVLLLLDRGANIHANNDEALCRAAQHGHTEIVCLLLDRGAHIHADNDQSLRWAAQHGQTETVRLLLDRGANIHAWNDQALRFAALCGHVETVHLLRERGADATALTTQQQLDLAIHDQNIACWQQTVRMIPPGHLEARDARVFKPALFTALVSILKKEGYSDTSVIHPMVYAAMALLQNETRALQYLKKWGEAGKQPLHDVVHMINLPKDLSGINLAAWGDAVLQHGPKMAQLTTFSDRIPIPLRSQDSKSWSYLRTRAEAAKFSYSRAPEHPELAALCFTHAVGEDTFNTALDLVQKQPSQQKNLPEITIAGHRFGMDGAMFKKLANDDVRGLFLGKLTNCCQSIGNAGEECATHGFTSRYSGFYVVETPEGEIIGQTWAWTGSDGELCFDSLETLGQRVSDAQWKILLDETAKELTMRNDHDVTALHVGTGGKTPASLQQHFTSKAATPIDYKGYRDSTMQIRVWKKPDNALRSTNKTALTDQKVF